MTMESITSRKNETIKTAAKLLESKERIASGMFLAEGARLCADAAVSGIVIEQAFFTKGALEKYASYAEPILGSAKRAFLVEDHVAVLLSDTKNPQGVFCFCRCPGKTFQISDLNHSGRYLALEDIQDPGNMGTMLRTAEALGVAGVILAGKCCDCFGPKALRAGMGAAFRLPVFLTNHFPECAKFLEQSGFQTYAAVPAQDALAVTKCQFSDGGIVVIGNEGNGLHPESIQACNERITIPMMGRAESLNAASSAAILMWELMKEPV